MDENNESIEELRIKLEQTEETLHQAAIFGKQLVEDNQELHNKLQQAVKDHHTKLEVSSFL